MGWQFPALFSEGNKMNSRDFDLRRKPQVVVPQQPQQVQQPEQQPPHSVWKHEVLPRLGIFAFMAGFSVMSGLNNAMKRVDK